jgi:tryptophan-rich sensory protein
LAGLVVSFGAVALVSALGNSWTDTGPGSWYDGLAKPSWTPPGWVFGVVWTALYAMMATAAWLVGRCGLHRGAVRLALGLYAVQLLGNLGWTWLFFGQHRPDLALLELGALALLVAATAESFRRVRSLAGTLLLPYLGWVGFAWALNAWIAANN